MLDNKTILITGGTGSFGHAFTKAVLTKYKPKKVIVFSRDEFKQDQMSKIFPTEKYPIRYFLGDVRDKSRLVRAFEGVDYVVGLNPYKNSGMGMALLSDHGFCKILIDRKTRKILGAHIVGEEASDMIHMLIAFMNKQGTLDDLLNMIYIHPALPEIVRNAARKAQAALAEQKSPDIRLSGYPATRKR